MRRLLFAMVPTLVITILASDAVAQRRGGGAVSGGVRGAVVGGMVGGSEGAQTGAKVGAVTGATRAAVDREAQRRAEYQASAAYQSAPHSQESRTCIAGNDHLVSSAHPPDCLACP